MGRLIDASELIEIIEGNENLIDLQKEELIECVNACDTAYDVEAVVKELEDLKKVELDREDECDEDGFGDGEQIYSDGRSQGKFEAFGRAIEIVKGGGVDNA